MTKQLWFRNSKLLMKDGKLLLSEDCCCYKWYCVDYACDRYAPSAVPSGASGPYDTAAECDGNCVEGGGGDDDPLCMQWDEAPESVTVVISGVPDADKAAANGAHICPKSTTEQVWKLETDTIRCTVTPYGGYSVDFHLIMPTFEFALGSGSFGKYCEDGIYDPAQVGSRDIGWNGVVVSIS